MLSLRVTASSGGRSSCQRRGVVAHSGGTAPSANSSHRSCWRAGDPLPDADTQVRTSLLPLERCDGALHWNYIFDEKTIVILVVLAKARSNRQKARNKDAGRYLVTSSGRHVRGVCPCAAVRCACGGSCKWPPASGLWAVCLSRSISVVSVSRSPVMIATTVVEAQGRAQCI